MKNLRIFVGQNNRQARNLIDETGENEVRLLNAVDSRETLSRLSRQFDARTVESRDLDEITDLLDSGGLDGAASRQARDLIEETDGAGIKLLDEVDDASLQKLLDSDAIETDDLVAATRKYGDLDSDKRSQFRDLLADDDLRDSWVKSVSSDAINSQGVRQALDDVKYLRTNGYEPTSFTPGQQLAEGDEFYETWYGSGYQNPVDGDSIAIDARTTSTDTWYRFNTGEENVPGPFFVDKRQVDELVESGEISSVEEFTDKLALREDKDMVVEFEVEAGTNIRVSEIGENFGGEGGLRQFEPRSDSMLMDSDDLAQKDFPGGFGSNEKITEVINIES